MALLEKAMQEERRRLQSILDPLLGQETEIDAAEGLSALDLDREKARENDWKVMQTILATNDIQSLAAASRNIHEDHRLRRDMKIATAGHKELLLSALKTAFNRSAELTYQINLLQQQHAQ